MAITDNEKISQVLLELKKTDEERFIFLGELMTPQGLGLDEEGSKESYKEIGEKLFKRLSEEIKDQICRSERIKNIIHSKEKEDVEVLVLPILDIVATILNGPPIYTATAILINKGIHRYCSDIWS